MASDGITVPSEIFVLPLFCWQEEIYGFTVDASKIQKLHKVYSSFLRFTFQNVGLRLFQHLSRFHLDQTSLEPGIPQLFQEASIL